MEALDLFYPDRMASRILGMGDVISLVERAQQAYDEDEARRLNQKIRKISSILTISCRSCSRSRRWVT